MNHRLNMDQGQNETPRIFPPTPKPGSEANMRGQGVNPQEQSAQGALPLERRQELVRKHFERLDRMSGKPKGVDELRTQEMMIERGILPAIAGGAGMIDVDSLATDAAKDLARRWNRDIARGKVNDREYIQERQKDIQKLLDNDRTLSRTDFDAILSNISEWEEEAITALRAEHTRARGERFGMYLQTEDIDALDKDSETWLNDQFDTLYRIAQKGQELNSPVVNNIQTVVAEAIRWLQYHKEAQELDKFQTIFNTRFNLMQMRTTIGYKSIEDVQHSAYRLSIQGLLYGLGMEDGKVGSMFNRMAELLEDMRLKSTAHHVTPEVIGKLQDVIIEEEVKLAEAGVGLFSDTDEENRRADITRAVRTAYDVLVSSQRQAVIVARGKHLTGADAYFSDPIGPLNVYNFEDLLLKKFDLYTAHEEEFVKKIKLDMADSDIKGRIDAIIQKAKKEGKRSLSNDEVHEIDSLKGKTEDEREELGRRLFRDLFAVPDFFSSGWRIKGILESLDQRFGKEKAKDFGLFLRLKAPGDGSYKNYEGKKGEDRKEVWGRIAQYRPEEIIRLFRERSENDLNPLYAQFKDEGIENYDMFKEKYGSVMRALKEKGYRDEKLVDFANLSPEQIAEIDKALGVGEGQRLVTLSNDMQRFITDKDLITELVVNTKFEDIYTRTLLVDDALLDKLEQPEDKDIAPLSKKYSSEQGGDALVRIWNDTANAAKAGAALVGFIKTEDDKGREEKAIEFAEATSQYNGQAARAKCVRFTIGTLLNLAKKSYFWDVVGLEKLPFRLPMSEIEKLYGPQAKPISRGELREKLDHLRAILTANLDKETEDDMRKSPEERAKLLHHRKENAEKMYKDLEQLYEITTFDVLKRRGFSLLLYLLVLAVVEIYHVINKAVSEKAA